MRKSNQRELIDKAHLQCVELNEGEPSERECTGVIMAEKSTVTVGNELIDSLARINISRPVDRTVIVLLLHHD